MAFILNIETATTACSVSVSKNGETIAFKETNNGYSHAENLHLFINEVMKAASLNLKDLNAIAISKGPGSYTGLRIGVSAAKGLAYGLSIPLIAVDTLQAMTYAALIIGAENAMYCPMLDARRMEVYTAIYNQQLDFIKNIEALIVDETSSQQFSTYDKIYFFGDGMPKSKTILSQLKNADFIDGIVPSAKNIGQLSFKKYASKNFEDVVYFEPFYLKDFLITTKKK